MVQGRLRRPAVAPWVGFALVLVVAMLGLALARTALDRGAFELSELNRRVAAAETHNERLRLEVARLESPARIGPMAEALGLVYPSGRTLLLVDGVGRPTPVGDPRWAGIDRYALEANP